MNASITKTTTSTGGKRIDWLKHDPPFANNGNDITACREDHDRFALQQRPIGTKWAYILVTGVPIGDQVTTVFA